MPRQTTPWDVVREGDGVFMNNRWLTALNTHPTHTGTNLRHRQAAERGVHLAHAREEELRLAVRPGHEGACAHCREPRHVRRMTCKQKKKIPPRACSLHPPSRFQDFNEIHVFHKVRPDAGRGFLRPNTIAAIRQGSWCTNIKRNCESIQICLVSSFISWNTIRSILFINGSPMLPRRLCARPRCPEHDRAIMQGL